MHRKLTPRTIALVLITLATFVAISVAQAGDAQVWHIKAIHPAGHLLNVKAIDADGGIFDVKAIEQTGNRYVLDVKAFVAGEVLGVKVLASDDWFGPVKAVRADGSYLDIKVLTDDDQHLDVKAVSRAGHVLDIKAIGEGQQFWGIKAVSPDGHVYDVKGLKLLNDDVELQLGPTPVRAHVKALPQLH